MTLPPILRRVTRWNLLFLGLIASVAVVWFPVQGRLQAGLQQEQLESIAPAEFSRLIQDLSEEDGYFRSDNFTSNETSYLSVVGKLRELQVSGGAYLGVGPEQNLTYIAKVRPRIAFIVDIRRQAMIQHLLYKAVFHTSENRAEFLSSLLCRPLSGKAIPGKEASVEQLLEYFGSGAAPDVIFASNLVRVRNIIQRQFHFPLSEPDQQRLERVYSAFHQEGLGISFRTSLSNSGSYGGFPSLKDLVLQTDLKGNLGNFLASEEDYRSVRNLHLKNRIIPVVGDFAGPKALAAVGGYLRKNGYTVRAFYTSNVEQFLFQNAVFGAFVENVRKLPIDSGSVFIRAVSSRGQPHPAHVPGHRTTTVLQKISVFLKDYDEGAYSDYRDMVTTHFIAAQ